MSRDITSVPGVGLEPTRPFGQRILSPPRLPFRHPGERVKLYSLGGSRLNHMSETAGKSCRSGLLVKLILFIAVAVGIATLFRRWALTKSDEEFEARLRAADEIRD